jgi:hypothetical protein
LIKIAITGFLYGLTGQQDYRGWIVMIVGTLLFTTISIFPIMLLFFFFKTYILRTAVNFFKIIVFLLVLILINEISYFILFPESTLRDEGYVELIFRICDISSVIISGYLCFILPIQKFKK